MDYRTLFIFDAVSLVVYAIAISVLALRNRKITSLSWFAVSVLLQLAQTLLQAMRGLWPPMVTVLLPTLVDGAGFFAMYMGFHWTLRRRPLKTWVGPVLFSMALTGYAGLYFLHSPYDFIVGMAPVFVSAGLAAGLLVRLGKGPIETVSQVTAGVLAVYMALLVYRTVVISGSYGYGSAERSLNDARLLYSMLGLMVMGGCLVLMYVWFFVAERWGDLALTARLDPLTGVLNRRAVDEGARREISRARRSGTPLALLVMDIDHFKRINDVYGHRGGDEALRAFVAVLRGELREVDILGRIGGEEFVVFLPDTTAERGMQTAERLRAATELSTLVFGSRVIKLTMTTGVTQLMPNESSWEGMLARADEALYTGKKEGRNRVVLDRQLLPAESLSSGTLHRFPAPVKRN
jgi:diguanylate cyclase (GGDEF)-like protein